MSKIIYCEVLYYDRDGNYVMLDIDPYGLSKRIIIRKAIKELKERFGLDKKDILDSLYLLPEKALKLVKELKK